jgi:hypothetical protein
MDASPSTQLDSMPRLVKVGLGLMAASFALAILRVNLDRMFHGRVIRVLPILIVVFVLFLQLYGLACRLNWVRWLTIVLSLLGIPYLPRVLSSLHDPWQITAQIAVDVLFYLGVTMLCLKPARLWFGGARSPNNALERERGQ